MKLKIFVSLLISIISISLARTGAKYIIIAPDNFVQSIQPLADWKTKKGMKTIIAPLSVTGNTASQIKNYITNAYNNWEIRPEYVLLAGFGSVVPTSGSSDDYYANMTGNYQIELSVGRFPCTTVDQCNMLVAKVLGYERTPYLQDTLWFKKGTTLIGEDNPPDQYYQPDCRYIRTLWINSGYIHTDSFISTQGNNSTDVMNAINDGRTFVAYRGQSVTNWWSPFNNVNPSNLTNGFKLPVVISGTCATMSLTSTGYQGDRFLIAGTAQDPKGSVAYFGTTVIGSHVSLPRGLVSRGFFKSVFEERTYVLGDAAKRGKFYMDSIAPDPTRYGEWQLFGDPAMSLWTKVPKRMLATYDSVIPLSQNYVLITVQDHLGLPLQQALVCIKMDTTIYAWGNTNSQGQIELPIQSQNPGVMDITVTATNYLPFEGTARLIPSNAPYINYDSSVVNDSLGNSDGKINPGETIRLMIFLCNEGAVTANNVQAYLRTTDPLITIIDSICSFGSILAGQNAGSQGFYKFTLNPNCRHNYQLNFQLHIQDDQSRTWDRQFNLSVYAGKINFTSSFVNDSAPGGNGNTRLGSREAARIYTRITNVGENLTQLIGLLRSQNPYITITDSLANFGNLNAGASNTNTSDPFAVSASPNLPKNYPINFSIILTGQGGTYTYRDTLTFSITTENGTTADPTGPDGYGYWSYDNTDTASGRAPTYSWFEIGPTGPGSLIDSITNRDCAVVTLPLPFTFRYYGQNYDSISVCSNGFLAMGRTSYRLATNSGIPDTAGPSAMIAPFWCDLNANENTNPPGAGDIYQYYDTSNHRWIVEFYDVAHYGQTNVRETFQAIILDPLYYPTQTGDGEIIYLYHTVSDPSISTIGIENQTESQGIQYMYNNNYNSTAAALVSGRAIKFTTQTPTNFQSPWIVLTRGTIRDSIGGNNNGIPEPNETIRLTTYLRNSGSIQAQNVIVILRNLDGDAIISDSVKDFGNIPQGGEVNNQTNPFVFNIAANPTDTILDFMLSIQAQSYSAIEYFSIGIVPYPGIEAIVNENNYPFFMRQNKPNPFRFATSIEYSLPSAQYVELKIFNAAGCLVRTLISENHPAGQYRLTWDGKSEFKQKVPAGVYYYTLKSASGKNIIKKMVLY
jgi:hypothetical protein